MSTKKANIYNWQEIVKEYLNNYEEDIEDDVEEAANEIAKKAKDEVSKESPRRKKSRAHQYYKGWQIKKVNAKSKYTVKIWNKTNYQLTHLLEFGHRTQNGGKTKAIPHIRPVEEKYNVEFADLLKEKIRRGH